MNTEQWLAEAEEWLHRAREAETERNAAAKALRCKPDLVLHEIGRLLAKRDAQDAEIADLKRRAGET